jgi:hypothetical protein
MATLTFLAVDGFAGCGILGLNPDSKTNQQSNDGDS